MVARCASCGGRLPLAAPFCPHCSARQPVSTDNIAGPEDSASVDVAARRRKWLRILAIVAAALGMAGMGFAIAHVTRTGDQIASGRDLEALEAKQREHEQRLAGLQREIREAQHRAEAARRNAALEACHADAERIDASVSAKTANCMRELAQMESCKASNERKKGESLRNGCMLGLLAAALTGGGGLLLLGSCAAGEVHGESQRMECVEPRCPSEAEQWMPRAAREVRREGIPVCELGIEVVDIRSSHTGGLLVHRATAGAARAGLTAGDVIVRVERAEVRSRTGLETAIGARAVVELEFVRDGVLRSKPVTTTVLDGRRILGVELTTVEQDVPYFETTIVRVDAVSERSASFERGDIIVGLGESGPLKARELSRIARTSTDSVVRVERRGKRLALKIVPRLSGP